MNFWQFEINLAAESGLPSVKLQQRAGVSSTSMERLVKAGRARPSWENARALLHVLRAHYKQLDTLYVKTDYEQRFLKRVHVDLFGRA